MLALYVYLILVSFLQNILHEQRRTNIFAISEDSPLILVVCWFTLYYINLLDSEPMLNFPNRHAKEEFSVDALKSSFF